MKNFFKLLGLIAMVAVIGFSMASCNNGSGGSSTGGSVTGGNTGGTNGGTGGTGGGSSSIVNNNGEAWLQSPEFETGYIFKSDGTYEAILDLELNDPGTYTISGNQLSLDGEPSMTFSVSGDTLTLTINGFTAEPFKRKPVSIGW